MRRRQSPLAYWTCRPRPHAGHHWCPHVLRGAVSALNQGGTCGLVGSSAPGTKVTLDMPSLLFGQTVRGIIEDDSVPRLFNPALVTLHLQGRLPLDRLITAHSVEDVNRAVEDAGKGLIVKPAPTYA